MQESLEEQTGRKETRSVGRAEITEGGSRNREGPRWRSRTRAGKAGGWEVSFGFSETDVTVDLDKDRRTGEEPGWSGLKSRMRENKEGRWPSLKGGLPVRRGRDAGRSLGLKRRCFQS